MRRTAFASLLLVFPLAACATTGEATYPVDTKGPYTLDSGDEVRVSVYGDADLSKTYRVDDSGAIALPLVGAVPVSGQTTKAAASRIASALANGYMRSPDVAVEVSQYRPFFIQGPVRNSGQFPYIYGMTARAAVSTAGGFSETADQGAVTIYRRQGERMLRMRADLDAPIYPGDTIVVSERWF